MFRRSLAGFDLTDEGRLSLSEIRKSIEYAQRGFDRAQYQAVRKRKPFRIGHSLYIHSKVLPFLQRQKTPIEGFSHIALRSASTLQLKNRVLRGELQIGFGVMPILDKDLYVAPLAHESFGLCIPASHSLKDKIRLAIRDVVNEDIYWMPRFMHPGFYDHVTGYLSGVGYDLRNIHEARAIIEGINFVACDSGVALVPQSAARFQSPGVLFKSLTDKPIQIETALFVRRDQMTGAVREFVNTALQELQSTKTTLQ
jgi:DNA-binding transcriptional LysR family regulator